MKRTVLLIVCLIMSLCSVGRGGLLGRYFTGTSITSEGIIQSDGLVEQFSRIDANIDFWNGSQNYRWNPIAGNGDNYTVEWTGYVKIDLPGDYGFGTISDDGSQIWVDGELIVDNGEGQWYDWEDNMGENQPGEPNQPVYLSVGYHSISVLFYEGPSLDGIELWWLVPGSGPSDIPYYGTTFHGIPPTYNPNTNWNIVPANVLYSPDDYNDLVCSIDINGDGFVDFYEFAVVAGDWNSPVAPAAGDLTGDGKVDLDDLILVSIFWLEQCF